MIDVRSDGKLQKSASVQSKATVRGALCKKVRNTTEAISAIAAGEADRSFRLQKA